MNRGKAGESQIDLVPTQRENNHHDDAADADRKPASTPPTDDAAKGGRVDNVYDDDNPDAGNGGDGRV